MAPVDHFFGWGGDEVRVGCAFWFWVLGVGSGAESLRMQWGGLRVESVLRVRIQVAELCRKGSRSVGSSGQSGVKVPSSYHPRVLAEVSVVVVFEIKPLT